MGDPDALDSTANRGCGAFLAEGSVEECRYFLILAKDLGYGDTERLAASLEEVSRLLNVHTAAILASGF
jgi:four helix bundle protein